MNTSNNFCISSCTSHIKHVAAFSRGWRHTSGCVALMLLLPLVGGCSVTGESEEADDFATSGSAAADQRAQQHMAREAQIEAAEGVENETAKTLFVRLGGDPVIEAIVDDAVDRAIADPRVNVERKGLEGGIIFSGAKPWDPTPAAVAKLKKHVASFIALAAGGPVEYSGPEIVTAFADRQFTNIEFDAAIGCLQATLDKLGVADQEQRELLAIMETTREQVVEVR